MEGAKFIRDNEFDCDVEKFTQGYSYYAKMLSIDRERNYDKEAYDNNIKNIVKLATINKDMEVVLTDILEKFNIDDAILYVEKTGFEISSEYKQYIRYIVEVGKKKIVDEMKKSFKRNKTDVNQMAK